MKTMEHDNNEFGIVFKKLDEHLHENQKPGTVDLPSCSVEISFQEYDEIEEIRKLAAEISDPTPRYFTTT